MRRGTGIVLSIFTIGPYDIFIAQTPYGDLIALKVDEDINLW